MAVDTALCALWRADGADRGRGLETIARLGKELMQPGRPRRDIRSPELRPADSRPQFGRKLDPASFRAFPPLPAEKPRKPRQLTQDELVKLMLTDWKTYKVYIAACNNYYEWRESDQRNFLGLKPGMRVPVAAMAAFVLVLYFPGDGDWQKFANRLSPGFFSEVLGPSSGTFSATSCSPGNMADGQCAEG